MSVTASQKRNIIMHIGEPPSLDDLSTIAHALLDTLPEEIIDLVEKKLVIEIEDMPEDYVLDDMDVENAYDLVAIYKPGGEMNNGVKRTQSDADDVLILYRRPILDYWCEEGADFNELLRQILIEEIGAQFEFSDDDIEEMVSRHHPSML